MSEQQAPLWTLSALLAAANAEADMPSGETLTGGEAVTGISIDTRTIRTGDLFVALKDARDGHDFVTKAFENGAVAALVRQDYARQSGDGVLLRVDDPLQALEAIARAARARSTGKIIAVTGSAGKTTTKEMLRVCLERCGKTHASEKSYNNHWGVPLTLARMPAETEYAVIEIGMNHPGEITPLSKLARPHVAVITTIAEVHLAQFDSVEAIADAKAEIFEGVEPGGITILPGNNKYFTRLRGAADARGVKVQTFGDHDNDVIWDENPENVGKDDYDQHVVAVYKKNERFSFGMRLAGEHMRTNALAVILALRAVKADMNRALPALAELDPQPGRGKRSLIKLDDRELLLIDESYNANPLSMKVAIRTARDFVVGENLRLVLVLGDMLELGEAAPQMHAGLAEIIKQVDADAVFACGPMMKHLFDALPDDKRAGYAPDSAALEPLLLAGLKDGDAVMIKGSNGSRMARLVEALSASDKTARVDAG